MKKPIALLLIVGMLLCMFVGCAEKEPVKPLHVIFVAPSTASEFWSQVEIGVQQAEADYEASLGIEIMYEILGPADENNTEKYLSILSNAIAAEPDAILTAAMDIEDTLELAREATAAGMVMNFINCGVESGNDGTLTDAYNQIYYTSNQEIGEMAAKAFLTALGQQGSTAGGVIGMQAGVENTALALRLRGFADYMEANGAEFLLAQTRYHGNSAADAQADALWNMEQYGNGLLGTFAADACTAEGVCGAMSTAENDLICVSVDSSEAALAALREGTLSALVARDAYQLGYRCMENAIRTVKEGANPETAPAISVPPVLVTAQNMDEEEIAFLLSPSLGRHAEQTQS